MIGRLLQQVRKAVTGTGGEDGEKPAFAGSLLDWSVKYGHGQDGGRREAAREMTRIQAKAEMLDEQDQYRR